MGGESFSPAGGTADQITAFDDVRSRIRGLAAAHPGKMSQSAPYYQGHDLAPPRRFDYQAVVDLSDSEIYGAAASCISPNRNAGKTSSPVMPCKALGRKVKARTVSAADPALTSRRGHDTTSPQRRSEVT